MAMEREATDDTFRELQKLKSDSEALQKEVSSLQAKINDQAVEISKLEQKYRQLTHGIMDMHVVPNVTLRDWLKAQEIVDPQVETTRRPFKISHLGSPLSLSARLHHDAVRCESSPDHTFVDTKVGNYIIWIVDNAEDRFTVVRHGEETWISTAPPKFVPYGAEMRLQFGVENLEMPLDFASKGDLERYGVKRYENELMTNWVEDFLELARVRRAGRV